MRAGAVRADRALAAGVALVLASAAAIAVVPTAARLAFEAGSNTLTVVTARGLIGAALLAAFVAASGRGFAMPRRSLRLGLLAGLAYSAMSYGFIGAVAYVPVAVAVLVYFTHPVLLAILAHARGGEQLSPRRLALALAALAGLGLVLWRDLGGLDPRGVALAALASVAVCAMILLSAAAQREATSAQVNLVMTGVTVGVFGVVTTAAGAWAFPAGALGWLGLAGAGAALAVGLLAFFAAFPLIGPVRATMLSNVEPLLGILFAAAVLGERLDVVQWAGVLLVVASLVLFEMPERRGSAETG
ncbi:EamA family transporter [Falsiroseomonas sp. CW058]|uniref:EamA family transporter n=1 Tax=Falsiroseomonas sp. CW058 TaxID=3388664 RepID=UPI003D31C093